MNILTHCPDCGAKLNAEEQAAQECWSCGWPDGDTPLAEISSIPPGFFPDTVLPALQNDL